MKFINTVLFVILLLISGCNEPKEEKKMNIFGGMAAQNKTKTTLDVSIIMDGRSNDFGVLVAKATKAMGFGQFELGKELKVKWIEDFSGSNPTRNEVFFDSTKLYGIAARIKEIEFVYWGDNKWKLRAYKEPHRNEKDLLVEIDSTESNSVAPVK